VAGTPPPDRLPAPSSPIGGAPAPTSGALVILRMVADRLRYADAQQSQFATHDVVGRVAERLVELGERFGAVSDGRVEIELPLSQEELASWTGAPREAVSEALQLLRSLRIVETHRRHITLLDPDALRRRAG
jgi:CRP/FNR family cyclic AMP-dependent transcriptional regulator